MPVLFPLVVSSLLFAIGTYAVMARRHAVLVLMGVELMLNAVNLNLVTFDAWWHDRLDSGQSLALFVIAIAAAEVGLGLAIVLLVFRTHRHINVDGLRELADRDTSDGVADGSPLAGSSGVADSSPVAHSAGVAEDVTPVVNS
jgi:NADH-quinone oxidoreductase subunit K